MDLYSKQFNLPDKMTVFDLFKISIFRDENKCYFILKEKQQGLLL